MSRKRNGRIAALYLIVGLAIIYFEGCSLSESSSDKNVTDDDELDSSQDNSTDSNEKSHTDVDADSDTDTDNDTDADWDTDASEIVDIDVDTDTDTETESETEEDCDIDNDVVLYLSADDSNSMAGPALARFEIENDLKVYRPIRTYEFLNYYNFSYTAAESGHVNVSAQLRETGDVALTNEEAESLEGPLYSLQIGVRAPNQKSKNRRPLNLTLSLDTSGSMAGQPIEMVRQSCLAIAGSLRSGDLISMVEWSSSQTVILESYRVTKVNDPRVVSKCRSIESGGSTDLNGGLVRAYELARTNFSSERINRVILMSDGGANTGVTSEKLIADAAKDANGEAIYLVGVGMSSPHSYSDVLMDTVTDAGKGAYVFIDSASEAKKIFNERFLSVVEVAARDVQVELTLPPSFDIFKFFGEEFSGDPKEVEPQHLAPNDAMIFNQLITSCNPDVVSMDDPVHVAAMWKTPLSYEEKVDRFDTTLGALLEGDTGLLLKGDAIVAYAEALKSLRTMSSGEEARAVIDRTLGMIYNAEFVLGADPDLTEIKRLLSRYRNQF